MKKSIHFLLFVLLIIATSCETRIPSVDTTSPTFSFEIRGDGFSKTFTQDDDFSAMQLKLKANTVFSFIYSGTDSGGLALIQWQLGGNDQIDFIRPEFPVEAWTIREISPLNRMIEWTGDRSNPKTGGVLTGNLRTGNLQNNLGAFRLFARDFGGQSGTPNRVRGDLNILIGNFDTELEIF